jgi:NADH-quinone oxidoreductase subunit J
MAPAFYIASAVAVISTFLAITRRNAMHALLYLIVSLLAVALVFLLMGAYLVAALEVIIYAGAIMVLFIFVIMMLNIAEVPITKGEGWLRPEVWAGPALLALVLAGELIYILARGRAQEGLHAVSVKQVGIALYGPYMLGAELASLLLLAGLVGAYHLGRRDVPPPKGEGG